MTTECGCRKGAIAPGCPRHDTGERERPLMSYRRTVAMVDSWSRDALRWARGESK